jgi:biotin carboxyl carrier protein
MAGVVKSVLVQAGDSVQEGQPLVILDAMKMEVPISAPVAGTVASVEAKEGLSVQEGQVLIVLE